MKLGNGKSTTFVHSPPITQPGHQNANLLPPCHVVKATLNHLRTVFKDQDKNKNKDNDNDNEKEKDKNKDKDKVTPNEEVYRFYQAWLVVNNRDYKDSPFYTFKSAGNLFNQ